MRKAVAVLLLALVAVAAAVSSAQAAQKGLDLDDPSALRAALSHHDRRMDGAEDPQRFLEKARGKEPHYYGAAHDAEDDGAGGDDDDDDDDDDDAAGVDEQHTSKGLRDAFKTYRFRGTSTQMRAQYMRFQELSARAQRDDLSAGEAAELESMQKRARAGRWGKKGGKKFSLKKTFTKIKEFGKKVIGGVVAIGGAAAAGASKVVNGGTKNLDKMLAQDIEDCVGCRFVWLGVELEVGNSQVEETVYDSFVKRCMEAEKAPIFFQTCQDMFDDVYGMIGDYMNGYTVNQVCEGAKMCR